MNTAPHRVERSDKKHSTGVPGISYLSWAGERKGGVTLHYFVANVATIKGGRKKKVCRRFCLETLGRQEAWRRALALRAEYQRNLPARASKSAAGGRAGAPTTPTRKMPAGNPDAGRNRTSKPRKQSRPTVSQE